MARITVHQEILRLPFEEQTEKNSLWEERSKRERSRARGREREGGREKERSNEEEREAEEKEENKRTRRSTCDLREREKPRIPPERTDKEDSEDLEPDWMVIDPAGRSFADHTTIRSDVFGNEPIRLVRYFLGLL